jgi:predicted small metal-binding protein
MSVESKSIQLIQPKLLEHRQNSHEETDLNNQTVDTENAINSNESSRVTLKMSDSKVTLGKH